MQPAVSKHVHAALSCHKRPTPHGAAGRDHDVQELGMMHLDSGHGGVGYGSITGLGIWGVCSPARAAKIPQGMGVCTQLALQKDSAVLLSVRPARVLGRQVLHTGHCGKNDG